MSAPVLEEAARAVRQRLVPFLFLLYIFAYLDRINIGFAALQMNAALGLSSAVYGLGAGIFFLSYTAFEIPSNLILARVGARRWIARIMVTWGLVSAATMLVTGPMSFYALRFLLGAAEAGFFPGIIYYLTRWVPARERARTIATFMTATVTAGIVGGPISGALLGMDGVGGLAGWQWMFVLEGVPAALLGIVVWRWLPDTPADASWLSRAQQQALMDAVDDEQRAPQGDSHGLRGVFTHPWLWVLAAVYFVVPVALYAFGFFLPQILQLQFAGTPFQIGLLSAIPYMAGAMGMVAAAKHSDATGERHRHVAAAALVSAFGFAATAWVQGLWLSLACLSVAMLGLASMFGPFWTLATSFVSGRGAAAGIALINSVGNIGGFVGPSLVGALRDSSEGFTSALLAVGTTVLLGGLLVLAVPDPQATPADRRR